MPPKVPGCKRNESTQWDEDNANQNAFLRLTELINELKRDETTFLHSSSSLHLTKLDKSGKKTYFHKLQKHKTLTV